MCGDSHLLCALLPGSFSDKDNCEWIVWQWRSLPGREETSDEKAVEATKIFRRGGLCWSLCVFLVVGSWAVVVLLRTEWRFVCFNFLIGAPRAEPLVVAMHANAGGDAQALISKRRREEKEKEEEKIRRGFNLIHSLIESQYPSFGAFEEEPLLWE